MTGLVNEKRSLLLVDDDRDIIGLLKSIFQGKYRLLCAQNGKEALRHWQQRRERPIDLIILDLMLPDTDGEKLIRFIRREAQTPIIVLTAKGGTKTLVNVLDMGADDCIFKPFKAEEITARVRTQLRRLGGQQNFRSEILTAGDLVLDTERHEVKIKDHPLHLPLKEFDLLHFLMQEAGRVITKEELYSEVWGGVFLTDDNTINVHISRLRNKLRDYIDEDPIETIWGVGFRFTKKAEVSYHHDDYRNDYLTGDERGAED